MFVSEGPSLTEDQLPYYFPIRCHLDGQNTTLVPLTLLCCSHSSS